MPTPFHVSAGETITSAAQRAVERALETNGVVTFDFNGVEMCAEPRSDPALLVDYYHKECEERRAAYAASPAGKQAARDRERERAAKQREIEELERMFPNYWEDAKLFRDDTLEPLLDWLKQYALAADDIGVTANPEPIIKQLTDAGFTAGMHVTNDRSVVAKWTPRICAEWIVGQALSMGLRSHPGLLCGALRDWRKRCEAYELSVRLEP